ncbi:MAG: amidohydrolase [Planctomycetes bacterium]|nr:amidohydrolase [Planctomycetota bacterium]
MTLLTRRRALALLGLSGLGLVGARVAAPSLLAVPDPTPLDSELSDFVGARLDGVDRAKVWDVHCHVFGNGLGGSGCEVNPRARNPIDAWENARFDVFLAVSGVEDDDDCDARYVERLLDLHAGSNALGRRILLAFDRWVDEQGVEDPSRTDFFVPSEYVLSLAESHRQFEAGVSIHPYRLDALERLEAAAARGARLVKWLPAAMGIDPASPRCDPFYERLAALGMPLLCHAGGEAAVTGTRPELGNPLRLRRALEAGVRVIVAHCASLGDDDDLDLPGGRRIRVSSFDLFLRLMEDPRYERRLLADVSALTQVNRCGRPLETMLRAEHLHHRLLDGSDYPLPAVDPLVSTWLLARRGYVTASERALCNRLYAHNPLLFDLVLKRCLRVADRGRAARFSPAVFETAWVFA